MAQRARHGRKSWRTRRDPFVEVWPSIRSALEADPDREAKALFEELQRSFPSQFRDGQLRTLQRRVADWRSETGLWTRLERWTSRLLQGRIDAGQLAPLLGPGLGEQDVSLLLECIRDRGIRSRNRAVAILANRRGVPIRIIASILQVTPQTIRNYLRRFHEAGASGLVDFSRDIVKKAGREDYREALFAILHEPPSLYGINRTRWEMGDLKEVMSRKGFSISLGNIRQIIRNAGYKFRKARKVLTSPDPQYREELQRITGILSQLQPNELFFSVDEFGPFSVKIVGGRAFTPPGEARSIPQYQTAKGSLIITAGLELRTNQITHFYSPAKNTAEMIRLLDLLHEQHRGARTLYFSWDAASWHASKELERRVDELNAPVGSGETQGPRIELAPLPVSAQFLNVIESVFSGMARAVLHNSDYESVDACMAAIDRYFAERNEHYRKKPRRAGRKIWGDERVEPVFKASNNCKDPRWERED